MQTLGKGTEFEPRINPLTGKEVNVANLLPEGSEEIASEAYRRYCLDKVNVALEGWDPLNVQ